MSSPRSWIGAAEAAAVLRVSRATLYAYVSRGLVRSQATPGSSRERQYSGDDVDRLRQRTEQRRDPGRAAAGALNWGIPVLESSITLIDGDRLYYRGHDAVELSRSRSVAAVASLIWRGAFDGAPPDSGDGRPSVPRARHERLPFVARAQSVLAAESAADPRAFDVRPGAVAATGWRILRLLTRAATRGGGAASTIDRMLAHEWGVEARGVEAVRSALILCADHELNVSSFTARAVASAGSNPYAVVIAGLAALEGTRHGGAGARVESSLASVRRARRLNHAISERLRRGEAVEGFGHPLYRNGDPRAAALVALLQDRYGKSAELGFVLEYAQACESAFGEKPNIDFALAALARVLRLPNGSPLTLFAIGRTIGWIGHAIEQYASGQLIRPRAKYVGTVPAAPGIEQR